jgi:hypothetical protein
MIPRLTSSVFALLSSLPMHRLSFHNSGGAPAGGTPNGDPPPGGTPAPDPAAPAAGGAPPTDGTPAPDAKPDAKPDGGAPAAPTYALKLPDGSTLDADFVNRTAAIYGAQGLSTEAAGKLFDAQIAEIAKATTAAVEAARTAENEAMRKDYAPETGAKWIERNDAQKAAALADAEIGGTPEKLTANAEKANAVLKRFFEPAFIEEIHAAGFASHPDVIRGFLRIGRLMSEATLVPPGSGPSATEGKGLERLFTTNAPK